MLAALAGRGWCTRALVHRRPVPGAHEEVTGDLLRTDEVARAVESVRAVVHLAAVTHARRERDYLEVNVKGTRALLGAAARADVERLIHVSTRAIWPEGGWYSRSKLKAEQLVAAASVETTIVRLPEVYGTGGDEGVDELVRRARAGAPTPVVGDGRDEVCPIHVDDAVAALCAALEAPVAAGRTYTLAGECITTRRFAEECATAFGTAVRIRRLPLPAVKLAAGASRFLPLPLYPDQLARLRAPKPRLSPEAESDLGFSPRPLADGLRQLGGR